MKLTKKHIEDLKTEKGGYNYKTIEALGEITPPTSGWKERLIGKEISDDKYYEAVNHSNSVKYKKLPTHNRIKPLNLHIIYEMKGKIKKANKFWRLDYVELILERAGSKFWEIGIDGTPNLANELDKERNFSSLNIDDF